VLGSLLNPITLIYLDMNYLLKIKRWPLLLTIFVPVIMLEILKPEDRSVYSLFGSVWIGLVYLLWVYSVGTIKGKGELKLSIPTGILFCLLLYGSYTQYSTYDLETVSFSYEFVFSYLLVVIIFGYLLYFTSGAYVSFRRSKGEEDVSLLLTFVSFWFFPVGVWLMQPRLNEWQSDNSFAFGSELVKPPL
jgi:fluoride ion exporter CrcB/FEX